MFMGPCIVVYNYHSISTNEMQLFMLFIWW